MPLTRSGTDVREFLLPSIFEASTISQVREIPRPVDKAHSIVGSTGIGLVYKFDSSSSAADDGYEILRPDDTTWSGRWLLIPLGAASGGDGIYNVKSFGATGDGVTDDQAAIQSAIDEATTKEGGIVFFPSGDYLIKATLVLTPGVRLMGVSGQDNTTASGIGSTISSQTVATPSVSFTGDGTTNNSSSVEVSSLRIIDTGGSPTTAVTLTSARNCYINGCYFQGFSEASVNLFSGEGNIVDRVMVGSSDGIGIKFSGVSKQSQLSNSKIEGCASASGAVQIIGTVDGVRVQGNQITNNYGKGIYVSTPASTSEHIAIENNLFDGNDATDTGDQDVYFLAATSHTNVSVVGNQFVSVGTSTALKLESVSDSTIDNNSFAAANASVTLDATSDNNLLLGNKISGTTSDLGSGNRWDLGYDDDQINDRQLSKSPSNGLHFRGNGADVLNCPTSALCSFGDGINDFPRSGSAIITADDYTSRFVCGRQGSSALEEWTLEFDASDKLVLYLFDESATATLSMVQDTASVVDGETVHVAFTYDGRGGATASAGIVLYINGVVVPSTVGTPGGTYVASEALTQPTTWGLSPKSGRDMDGIIHSGNLFNRELTAAEVLRLSINGNVPDVSDQYGGADLVTNGDFESWSSATNADNWSEIVSGTSTINSESAAPAAGTYSVRMDVDGSANAPIMTPNGVNLVVGKRYRITVTAKSDINGRSLQLSYDGGGFGSIKRHILTTSYAKYVYEFVNTNTANSGLRVTTRYGEATESVFFDGVIVEELGAVLALQPGNIEISGIWTDATSNRLNGVSTGATQILPKTLDRDYVNYRQLSKAPSNGLSFPFAADHVDGTGLSALIGLSDFVVTWTMAWHSDSGGNQYIVELGTSSGDRIRIESNRIAFNLGSATYLVGTTLTVHEEVKHYALTADRDGNATLYINGTAQADTPSIAAEVAYSLADSGWSLNAGGILGDITLYNVNVFNRLLTAAEILRLSANGSVPEISQQYGGALGGAYTSDFTSDSVDGWTADNANTPSLDATATLDGDSDNLKFIAGGVTGTARMWEYNGAPYVGKRVKVSFDYLIPAGQTYVDGFRVGVNVNEPSGNYKSYTSPTADGTWQSETYEFPEPIVYGNDSMFFKLLDGGSTSINALATGEFVAFRNIKFTLVGAILSLQSDNIQSAGDWIDSSTNELNGTATGTTPLMVKPQQTGTFTPTLAFATPGTGVTYGNRVGRWTMLSEKVVYVEVSIALATSLGTGTGNAEVGGLPFTSYSDSAWTTATALRATGLQSLTGALTAMPRFNSTQVTLRQSDAQGDGSITHANFTTASTFGFNLTYEIA